MLPVVLCGHTGGNLSEKPTCCVERHLLVDALSVVRPSRWLLPRFMGPDLEALTLLHVVDLDLDLDLDGNGDLNLDLTR